MGNNIIREHRQREGREAVLQAIVNLTTLHDRPPTRVEIAAETGLSINTVKKHVATLIEQGRLIDGHGHRALHIP